MQNPLLFKVLFNSAVRPLKLGTRSDGLICSARGGECRFNFKYHGFNHHDDRFWKMPVADEDCSMKCPYLEVESF